MFHNLLASVAVLAFSAAASAVEYSPYAGEDFPMQLLWGDTHVHSSFSMDANVAGNARLGPAEAYRFARGEVVTANNGMKAQLNTPLDFLVVSDHAEYMGILPRLRAGDPALLKIPAAKQIYQMLGGTQEQVMQALGELIGGLMTNKPIFTSESAERSIWQEITAIADANNQPGSFSALIGYEYTSMPQGDNLHRVVMYRDDAAKARQMIPISAFDSERPEDLWAFMAAYEEKTGGQILAIPHNANLSNGLMFALQDSDGKPFTEAYVTQRARWEPVVEVTQIKGDGESHPLLSPDDEFADFENWDTGNLRIGSTLPKRPDMLQYEYARSALKLGLAQQAKLGSNPFKFGMIGSTDAHTGLATAAEDNFWGKATLTEPGIDRRSGVFFQSSSDEALNIMAWQQLASGYAAVWARTNTRAEIFDAMQRKEVYATTGSRIAVRFFGGWDFTASDVQKPNAARIGYRKGVPMGGDLPVVSSPSPSFMVWATKDPNGANLDRIQIIKGWRDSNGELQEKVYNVAVSDGRPISAQGDVAELRSTVDAANASYSNDAGATALGITWQDPDFNADDHAFYYARVLEISTPRWNAIDVKRLEQSAVAGATTEIQERAYTSPIWYTPKR